ncbi:MAG: OsmC family protein, partial [Planctomycetes bacterium]|nr:OsmC family protein [Planctomycetota bacterium]
MVKIQIRYAGDLRCHATHGPSSTTLSTDAPVDNQGRGESFSPTDLVATALGTCMLTIMGIVARRHGWDLSDASVEVEKTMVATGVRRIGSLGVVIRVPANLDAAARAALENAAHTCPVHKSLHPDIQIPVR